MPEKAPEVKPVTVTLPGQTTKFYAYSRTGRKASNGSPALHDIAVKKDGHGAITSQCTCPGFVNHGHCWASSEAMRQMRQGSFGGFLGVWKRA